MCTHKNEQRLIRQMEEEKTSTQEEVIGIKKQRLDLWGYQLRNTEDLQLPPETVR